MSSKPIWDIWTLSQKKGGGSPKSKDFPVLWEVSDDLGKGPASNYPWPLHLGRLLQFSACCAISLDGLRNYTHFLSFAPAFPLECVSATLLLPDPASIVFSQGSGRNPPHRDLIIYQHNVGCEPVRHQYIFLWSLTYCLLFLSLFSRLANK